MSKLSAISEIVAAMATDVYESFKESDYAVLALTFFAGLGVGVFLSWLL